MNRSPRERPIIFSADMVKAIIAGRKTQTRRVVKSQPASWQDIYDFEDGTYARVGEDFESLPFCCPYGRPGDRLWVREAFKVNPWIFNDPSMGPGTPDCVSYRADGEHQEIEERMVWSSPIYMPRWAARLLLEVTCVRVERVQEISEQDAIAEGCQPDYGESGRILWPAIDNYADLWDSINKKRGFGWDSNSWVWAISFRVLDCRCEPLLQRSQTEVV